MARLSLFVLILASTLGLVIQPAAALDQPVLPSNPAVLSPQVPVAGEQLPLLATASPNDIVLASAKDEVCYKIRAYIFKRDDDHAPEFLRSTTCGPRQPHAKNVVWPKARVVPAN